MLGHEVRIMAVMSCTCVFIFWWSHPAAYSGQPLDRRELLEIIEARCESGSMIFCTQYEPAGWYERINTDPDNDSPISAAIMDRIVHNSYEVLISGRISMRERHGLNASRKEAGDHE